MIRHLDIQDIDSVEFGVCLKHGAKHEFRLVPVDSGVQQALKEMLEETYARWKRAGDVSEAYDPAQEHKTEERLTLTLTSPFLSNDVRQLYKASNIPSDSDALQDVKRIYFYFAVFKTATGDHDRSRTILAVRRSTTFKGLASKRNLLVSWMDDTLKIIPDTVFRFDSEFDLYIDGNNIIILRPKVFESIASVDEVVLKKAAENVDTLSSSLPFLDLSTLTPYVSTHRRSARLLASLVARNDLGRISKKLLKKHCKDGGITLKVVQGRLVPDEGNEEKLLRVLDRRRYTVTLIENEPETYDASSRKRAE